MQLTPAFYAVLVPVPVRTRIDDTEVREREMDCDDRREEPDDPVEEEGQVIGQPVGHHHCGRGVVQIGPDVLGHIPEGRRFIVGDEECLWLHEKCGRPSTIATQQVCHAVVRTWPATLLLPGTRASAAITWAWATFSTYVQSIRLLPSPCRA